VLLDSEEESGAPDWAKTAEAAYTWFAEHGALFFRTLAGEPFLFFEETIFWMDSSDRCRRRLY
jgi:hypothetical protein